MYFAYLFYSFFEWCAFFFYLIKAIHRDRLAKQLTNVVHEMIAFLISENEVLFAGALDVTLSVPRFSYYEFAKSYFGEKTCEIAMHACL